MVVTGLRRQKKGFLVENLGRLCWNDIYFGRTWKDHSLPSSPRSSLSSSCIRSESYRVTEISDNVDGNWKTDFGHVLKARSVAVEALEPTTAKRERTERQIAFSSAEAKFEIGPPLATNCVRW